MLSNRRAVVAGALLSLLAIVAWPPTEAAALACGDVITDDTTLEHDLLDCPGDGLIIGADNVTLRLNGFMIDGTRTPAPQRLASTRSIRELVDDMRALQQGPDFVFGVRNEGNDHVNVIGPGVIREFDSGIDTSFSTRGRISSITLLSNGFSIDIGEDSFRLLIDNNNATDTGIIGGTDRGEGIRQISIIRNFVRGIVLSEATAQVVANSVVGRMIVHRDDGSLVNNNNVFGSGITIDGFDNVIVSNNKTDGGIRLSGDALEGGILRNTSVYLNVVQNAAVGVVIFPIFVLQENTVEANRLIMNDDQILQREVVGITVRNNFCDPPDDDPPCSTDFDPGEVVDSDVDSVLDGDDECPGTDFQAAVVINGIDTNIANMLIERSGCTMMDLIHEAAVAAEDRSDFIAAVALLTHTWLDDDLIDKQDAGIIRGAASGTPVF